MEGKSTCIHSEILLRRNSIDSTAYFVTFVCIYVVTSVVSTAINGSILCTMIFSRELHGPFYKILSSLFVSDFITGLMIFPMLATLSATFEQPNCTLLMVCEFLVHTISFASILSMMAIAYDRYLRATKRQAYSLYMKKSKGYLIIVVIWIASPVVGALSILVYSKITAIFAVIIMMCIVCLYVKTLRQLKANKVQVTDSLNTRVFVSCHDKGVRRSSRLVFILIITMLVFWCPSIAISFMSSTMLYSTSQYFLTAVQQLPLLSALTSPFLYFWSNRTTRQCFVAFCNKIRCHSNQIEENNVAPCTH